jgi:hypothetical protein
MLLVLSPVRPGLGAVPWGRGVAAGWDAAGQRRSRVGESGDMSVKSGKYRVYVGRSRGVLPASGVVAAPMVARSDSKAVVRKMAVARDSNRLSGVRLNNRLNFHKSISLDDEYNIAIPHKDAASSRWSGPRRGEARREGEGVMRLIHLSQPVANGARRPLLRAAVAL